VKRGQNVPLSYNCANSIGAANLLFNLAMPCKPNIHPANLIRHAYSRYKHVRANTIGIVRVLQRMDTFKFKITLDRHNGIQNLNYYDLPDPPCFSLPSTFKRHYSNLKLHFISIQYRRRIFKGTLAIFSHILGARQETDIFVRLIDSATKQVPYTKK
jgi:hypothetical protein